MNVLFTNNPKTLSRINLCLKNIGSDFSQLSNFFVNAGITPNGIIYFKKSKAYEYILKNNSNKYMFSLKYNHYFKSIFFYIFYNDVSTPYRKYKIDRDGDNIVIIPI